MMASALKLSPQQKKAEELIMNAVRNAAMYGSKAIINGYAGSGKTSVTAYALSKLTEDETVNVAIAAPTHKALNVLKKKLNNIIPESNFRTVHNLVYTNPVNEKETLVAALEVIKKDHPNYDALMAKLLELGNQENLQFVERTIPEPFGTVIVDEASMLSPDMVELLESLYNNVVYIGDGGQLPPVKAKPGIDFTRADVTLDKIFRNAEDNPIPHVAAAIRQYSPAKYRYIISEAKKQFPDVFVSDPIPDAQNLVFTNRLRRQINSLSDQKKLVLGQEYIIHRGRREVRTSEYCKLTKILESNVYGNPYLHTCTLDYSGQSITELVSSTDIEFASADLKKNRFKKEFADTKGIILALPYAITVHKSQGSEYSGVNIFPETILSAFPHMANKWFYTAVTRAQEKVYIKL
jgi:thymidine kinase